MANVPTLTAIDIGTSKISTVIATRDEKLKQFKILVHATVASRGVKKGIVVDIEQVTSSLEECLEKTERMAGVASDDVVVSIGGPHISSLNSHGIVAISDPKGEIGEDDVERVIEAAKAVSLPPNRQILFVSPKQYTVDGQGEIRSPIGMSGIRLEVDCHLVTASATNIRNLDRIFQTVDVQNSGYIFTGDASAQATMSDSEKDLGVAVVDIGAGKTDLAVYFEGALHHTASIPIGARHITSDLAVGLRLPLETAEQLKIFMSDNCAPVDPRGALVPPDISSFLERGEVADFTSKAVYESIITARIEEIIQFIHDELSKVGYLKSLPAGVIFTGGGAKTIGLVEIARKILTMPLRIGMPAATMSGMSTDLIDSRYSTSIGLLMNASEQDNMSKKSKSRSFKGLFGGGQSGSVFVKLKKLVQQFLP